MRPVVLPLLLALLATPTAAAPKLASAGAGTTELLLALDAGPALVAVDDSSQLPAAQAKLPRLGYHRQLSAEGIIASGAGLLVGSSEMGPETSLKLVTQAGIKVIALPAATSGEQLLANIDQLAQLLGKSEQGAALTASVSQRLQALASTRQQLSARPPKVLFVLVQGDRPARVGGKGSAADLLIQLAGASNAATFDGYQSLSAEGMLALAPDLLLVSARAANADHAAQDLLKQLPLLALTPAGKNSQVISLPPQALMGGLGLSALSASEHLAERLLTISPQG